MRTARFVAAATLALALAFGSAPGAQAQEKPLREKDAKKLLKRSDNALKDARKETQRGRSQEARRHLEQYAHNLEQVNQALARGNVKEGDELDVAKRVDEATLKHLPVLEGLLGTVPAEAVPALERALQVSLTGHDVASQAVLGNTPVNVPGFLGLGAAGDAMDKNRALLDHAERSQKHLEVLESLRGRLPEQALPGLETAVTNAQRNNEAGFDRSMRQFGANLDEVTRAIEQGRVPDFQAGHVLDTVDYNTRRQIPVLERLLGQVPEQARPAIARALQASQRGNQAAAAAVGRTPAGGAGRPSAAGPPAGAGRQGGTPGGPPGGKRPGGPPK